MRSISYRTKLRLKAALKIALICIVVLVVLAILALTYLQRYVVYTEKGVYIDFNRSTAKELPSIAATEEAPTAPPEVNLIIGEPSELTQEASSVNGYYIDIAMLQKPEAVLAAVQQLPEPCAVLLDLKSSSGKFYYSTSITGAALADIDVTVVDEMISYLKNNGFTMIARIQTYRDSAYALENLTSSLAISSGALWSDDGYYWLNPGSSVAAAYLKQIITELSSMGFREIVLDDFYFPSSKQINYTDEQSTTSLIQAAAEDLLDYYKKSRITLSFGNPSSDFKLNSVTSHVFFDNADGANINSILSEHASAISSEKQLVFLTNSRDTRLDGYSLLRPLLQ